MQQAVAELVARSIVQLRGAKQVVSQSAKLCFSRVTSPAELAEVGQFRRRCYASVAMSYLLAELDERGLDDYDIRSFVYVARIEGRIIGTVRAVPGPFEMERYIGADAIQRAIEGRDLSCFLEVSRLLVEPGLMPGIASALTAFGGTDLLLHTRYRGYVAYVRERSGSRNAEEPTRNEVRFRIPARGNHEYVIVHGGIGLDLLWSGINKTARAAGRKPLSLLAGLYGRPSRFPRGC
jgi:hypothetical protein